MRNQNRIGAGCGVALITPFDHQKEVDFNALNEIVDYVIENGIDYIVSLGSTGEASTLSSDEQEAVLRKTIEFGNKRVPIIAGGFGDNSTARIVDKLKGFKLSGISGILSNTPAYNKPNQEGIYQHYREIAHSTPLPVILYNVPGRTSSNIENITLLRLVEEYDQIIAVKDATANIPAGLDLIYNKPTEFLFLSGDDPTCLPMLLSGGEGVISVIANAYPGSFSQLVTAAIKGNIEKANMLNAILYPFHSLLYVEGNPAGIKVLMQARGLCDSYLRLPLTPVSDHTKNSLLHLMDTIDFKA